MTHTSTRHRRRTFDVFDSGHLVADEYGPTAGPTVLFLHGGGQTRHSWGAAARAMGAAGWRAVSLDLPGHGESAWSPDGDYGIGRLAAIACRVWRELGPPLAVVGASLGGLMSMAAVGRPDAPPIAALVLVDIAPRVELKGVARIVAFMRAHPDGFETLEEAARHIAAYRGQAVAPRPEGLKKNLRRNENGRWNWHWDPMLMDERNQGTRMEPQVYELALQRLAAPILLVRGRRSDVISEANARELLRAVPHARYVDLHGAGHMVAGDANDAFAGSVIEFLREAMPPAAPAAAEAAARSR